MSDKPTEKAFQAFGKAANKSYLAASSKSPEDLAWAVNHLAEGLLHLSTGLRATYNLVDEVKQMINRQNQSRF